MSKHKTDSAAKHQHNGMPRHIAIIMDGNGRWATKRFLPRFAGHAKGVKTVNKVVEACVNRGIEYLTLFAFSSENWRRPPDEVSLLMQLFRKVLMGEIRKMGENNIRLKVVGDLSKFDADLQQLVRTAESETAANSGLTLTICANYGGRWDIVNACNKLIAAGANQAAITEEQISANLAMAYAPEPDMLIRTGGEARVSNFLLWQLAYAEFYFTDTFWPDFGVAALDQAIASFQQRERRFGQTSEQVQVK
ncbi:MULTISPECIES: polyprenyl diphosphate synthase [unclassified Undibacterium]|uniref:polyprenyl diphosphate synthase n=1 Tax=unclassified Undibacterium TaxID=2630295 RepID=UPI002AC9799E|nr:MULTISPECIES: polyprenyl diphosphate synthase [unclassified Undibacterium]MEB0141189.1 polyprenyl diphosphate synthase [Undibacterium sp. CCC2.1]MEB0174247.1 polyprenyl diphosphate synthase [Undibacterium sp. CCC1.1]MEB0178194.1 polyprenyl diphosphate synthase [Undibacterium sp. CCC3.4]MEB0217400.1 polyprenyl diphosphate synthase [Undibacterium sp. 5I2]WPX42136.1 polyprenyl diphosphate synthase [Undibacterium sp. CCC3.4]